MHKNVSREHFDIEESLIENIYSLNLTSSSTTVSTCSCFPDALTETQKQFVKSADWTRNFASYQTHGTGRARGYGGVSRRYYLFALRLPTTTGLPWRGRHNIVIVVIAVLSSLFITRTYTAFVLSSRQCTHVIVRRVPDAGVYAVYLISTTFNFTDVVSFRADLPSPSPPPKKKCSAYSPPTLPSWRRR